MIGKLFRFFAIELVRLPPPERDHKLRSMPDAPTPINTAVLLTFSNIRVFIELSVQLKIKRCQNQVQKGNTCQIPYPFVGVNCTCAPFSMSIFIIRLFASAIALNISCA